MTVLPSPTVLELIAALSKTGLQIVRNQSSHHFVRPADGRTSTVQVHAGDTIGPGLLTKILGDCECELKRLGVFADG